MLIINDFFARKIEAISFQMEAILQGLGGQIITAKRFFSQKVLQKEDIKDKIFVYYQMQYKFKLMTKILFSKDKNVFVFEEEPSFFKRMIINLSKKNLYVSMYRKPYFKYMKHLKKYNNLKKIFVEMEEHRKILLDFGFLPQQVVVSPTPAKISRKKNSKKYNPEKINLLFASWNNTDKIDTSYVRGLLYIIDCLKKYKNLLLTIILRDNNTKIFNQYVKSSKVKNRVKLINIKNNSQLEKAFDDSDFIIYMLKKQIVKDVPNSLIDGISRGKPILMTNVLSFSQDVIDNHIGLVFPPDQIERNFAINKNDYAILSSNAYKYSKKHTLENYINIIKRNCNE